MKNLPKMYKNENLIIPSHNKNVCFVEEENPEVENILFDILHNPANKRQKVWIKTSKKTYETYIIAKTKEEAITLENETIPISEIISIQKIK